MQWASFVSKPANNIKCIASHRSSIIHAPSVWGFIPFLPSRLICIVPLFHRLSPSHWEAVFLISGSRQWSGDRVVHHVRLASLPYYPEMCGRLQNPVKCSLYNLSVQTLPQDTAAVFFFFPSCSATKKENEEVGLFFTPRWSLAAVGFSNNDL